MDNNEMITLLSQILDEKIGMVTAYGYAKSKGYAGSADDFANDMANIGVNISAIETAINTFNNQTVPNAETAITTAGSNQVTAVNTAGQEQLQNVTAEGGRQVGLVAAAGTAQTEAVNTAGTTQTNAVNTAGSTQVSNVNSAGSQQITAIQQKGEETKQSIPADYTELSDSVEDLKNAIGNPTYTMIQGSYIDANGNIATNSIYDLYVVQVLPNGKVSGTCGNTSNGITYLAFYDANGDLVGTPFRNSTSGTFQFDFDVSVPSNAYVIKITHRNNVNIAFSVSVGEVIETVQDYCKMKPVINGLDDSTAIDFSTGTSGYINVSGSLATHSSYYHTEPISVRTGYTVTVTTNSVPYVVCIIAKKNSDNTYTPLVNGNVASISTYTYTATEDMDIVVSYRQDNAHDGNISFKVSADSIRELVETVSENIVSPINYAQMFHRVGVLGDSLASGEIGYTSGGSIVYVDKYDYSWLSNLCRSCDTEAVHYSMGGMTAKSWMAGTGGKKAMFDSDTVCNAYFIAFGTNDSGEGQTLGTISDAAGTDTFVGYMKQCIEYVHAKAPYAVVFLMSTYANSSTSHTWSDMIESIAGLYSYCYYVDFLNNTDIYTTNGAPYTSVNHFTTPAYVEVADTIHKLVNDIVKNNYADFTLFAVNN